MTSAIPGAGVGMLVLLSVASASAATTYDGQLSPGEVVVVAGQAPPVIEGAYDVALGITYDEATNVGCGRFVWSGLSGKPTALHVHVGAAGENTTRRWTVSVPEAAGAAGDVSFRIQGSAEIAAAFADRGIYGDVHTARYPGGEVRAQLDADPGNSVDCTDATPLVLDAAPLDGGVDAGSSSSSSSSSTSSSSSSSSSGGSTGRTPPAVDPEPTTSDGGGCHAGGSPANLAASGTLGLGLLALRRRRRTTRV